MNTPLGRRALAAAAAALAAPAVRAQAPWPVRPLRLVVPYAPGGSTDQFSRGVAERLARELGQPVVVENRAGASTIIGTGAVASAAPDGYTLLMASTGGVVLNPMLYRRLPFAAGDLTVLSVMVDLPLVLVVSPAVPARTLAGFVAWARTQRDGVNHATVGLGNPLHLGAEMFRLAAGFEMQNIVYPGSAPALTALLAGQVQMMVDVVSTALPHIRDGKLRPLGVTTRARLAVLPEVPTIAESGYPDYEATTWFGVAAPRGTPAPIQDRLRAALAVVQDDPAFRERFDALGLIVQPPRDLPTMTAMLAAEKTRWEAVIRARNLVLE